jgi:hypothetical protein
MIGAHLRQRDQGDSGVGVAGLCRMVWNVRPRAAQLGVCNSQTVVTISSDSCIGKQTDVTDSCCVEGHVVASKRVGGTERPKRLSWADLSDE